MSLKVCDIPYFCDHSNFVISTVCPKVHSLNRPLKFKHGIPILRCFEFKPLSIELNTSIGNVMKEKPIIEKVAKKWGMEVVNP